ncbi:methyl-accepting chemotaxis protein [Haloarcula sp. GH36]|uniref:methyl-accepting chemotaxis protein n=1 Tax=Haloarcula montana TaxID=3111776 RepID=UPI002D78CA75|nr:methyl-accepting chemotaxis protein [Haloarcula sp. GH36]
MARTGHRWVTAGTAGQFAHALYQVIVVGFGPPGLKWPLALGGLVVAAIVGWYTIVSVRARLTDAVTERDQRQAKRDGARTALAETEGELATVRAEREVTTGGVAQQAPAATDGGVSAADEMSHEELSAYIEECCATIDATNEGDLSRRMAVDTPSAALNELGTEFNEMAAAFQQTIETADEFSADVAGSSEQVTAATQAVKEASQNVAETVQGIADVFHEQHQQITTISDEMSQMSATIEEIAASSKEVTEMADKTERRTVEGIEAATVAQETMSETVTQTDEVVETVRTLDDQMTEVGRIVDLIDDIAEQTNILALNASIEAAHASSGSANNNGFGVVADEVKTLAEETKEATTEIETLIGEIQTQTEDAVDEISEMQAAVEDGQDAVEEGLTALESIMEHVEKTSTGVKEISNATDDQAATSEEVASIADDVAETSRENVEEAEHVAAIAEEQNLALGEVYVNAKMLTMRAKQLTALFERYDTDR